MKVFVNGCSHLKGTGLDQSFEIIPTLTWPNYVWTSENTDNHAWPGSSNDRICRRSLDHLKSNVYQFVCIQWTIFERIEVQIPFPTEHKVYNEWECLHSTNAAKKLNINGNPKFMHDIAKSIFLKQFGQQWFLNYNLSQILVLQNWLKFQNIPYIFVMTDWPSNMSWNDPRESLLDRNYMIETSWFDFCKAGQFSLVDNSHYEINAHKEFAKYITNQLTQKGLL